MPSLYDQIGGSPTITVVVGRFMDRAMDDPRLQRHFRHANLNRQRTQQMRFLSYALGGTGSCPGGSPAAHFGPLMTELGMEPGDLGVLIEHLRAAFSDVGLPTPVVQQATGAVNHLQTEFLEQLTPQR